mmetsp:Transcript_15737/g.23745  ORF Transcript_15737/g.23745 Transcript_15737/m.23745 type:complete len:293 (-) Transcript_15737:243-1121(-)
MSEIKPTTTATSNDGKKKRRSKVSFSEEVISKDKFGDGNKVLVKEEPGVFLSLLGQKRVVKTNENEINGAVVDRVATISFGGVDDDDNDDLLKQKLAYSEKQDGNIIMQSPTEIRAGSISDGVEYDNLIVKIGLLKIGHRYRMIVPIPNRWGQDVNEDNEQQQEKHTHNNDEVKIIEDSFDDDLRGEIETEYTNSTNDTASSTPSASCHHYLNITLSAKRRGPYRGRFVLELTRYPHATSSESPQKCIMSVQVDATIMGKDMGTPKLRNGVICLGKIVGYDSDDETEWQGFD